MGRIIRTEIGKVKLIALLGIWVFVYGSNIPAFAQETPIEKFPQENAYLHINSTLLFTGEYLYYKMYALNQETKYLSQLSKAGWVELINKEGNTVFKHKIKLENGQASSDFFVPVSLPSGNYKIVAYTNWMANVKHNYFVQDIYIINPYLEDSGQITISEDLILDIDDPEIGVKESMQDVLLEINRKEFKPREEVVIDLKNMTDAEVYLSLSIKQLDNIPGPERKTARAFTEQFQDLGGVSEVIILPELRGTLIEGKISEVNENELTNRSVTLSFPGEENTLRISRVNEKGEFIFSLDDIIHGNNAILQLLGQQENNYRIELAEAVQPDYSQLNFSIPVLSSSLKESILKRSINNQIENAYSQVKISERLQRTETASPFGDKVTNFILDDYNRFSDVSKTFTEVIRFAGIKRSAGKNIVTVRSGNPLQEFTTPALVVVDGVVLQDHQKLISYNAEKIKSIGVVREKYFIGPNVFEGVVVVETVAGDFPPEFRGDTIFEREIIIPELSKKYFNPNYSTTKLERIPDYRNQLLWSPDIILDIGGEAIKFFTSDVTGIFEIEVEGFTSAGVPVSIKETIVVE